MFGGGSEDVDPFSCFGSEGSSSNEENVDSLPDDEAYERQQKGRRLRQAANARQSKTYTATSDGGVGTIDHVPITSPGFEIYSCSNQQGYDKGQFGVRALLPYSAGEEIVRELPAMRVNSSIAAKSREEAELKFEISLQEAFDALSPTTAKSVMELSSCHQQPQDEVDGQEDGDKKTPMEIFQTNSYQLDDDSGFGGIFLTLARMNHSCRPNAAHYWRPDLHMMVVHAIRDIAEGEEICTCYGPADFFDTETRRSFLGERYSFECICDMCTEGNGNGGDDRMAEIRAFHENIMLQMSSRPDEAKKSIDRCLDLLKQQGIGHPEGPHVAPVLHYGYQNCIMGLNDKDLACSYVERELLSIQCSQGHGSHKAIAIQKLLNEAAR